MNIVVWLVIGGLIGWVASVLMRSPESIPVNVVVGIVGAFVGGRVLGPLVGGETINSGNFTSASIAVSLLGAVILLALLNVVRQDNAR